MEYGFVFVFGMLVGVAFGIMLGGALATVFADGQNRAH